MRDEKSINFKEVLAFISEKYDTDIADIQQSIEDMQNKKILSTHYIWEQDIKGYHYYVVWLLDENGRRLKQAKRRNREELEQLIIEHYNKVHCALTVADLYEEFLSYKKDFVKPNTLQKYKSDWNRFYLTDTAFVRKPFKSIKRTDIDAFFANMVKVHSLNTKAFNSACSLLRQMLIYACDKDYIEDSPFRVKQEIKRQCQPNRRKASNLETYTDEELRLLNAEMERRLENNPANTAPLGVLLAFELGLRIGELMAINRADIDFDNHTVYIHSQLSANYDISDIEHIRRSGYKVVDYTKTPQGERIIPLTDRALDIIGRILAINETYDLHCNDYIFVRENSIMPPKTVESQLKWGCEHINIKYRSPHKMRKTYASTLINNNVPITTVQTLLGHSEPSTTLRYYTFDNTKKSEVYENVKNILNQRFEG